MDKKITLYDVMKHSKLVKKVRIYDSFDLLIRPWTVLQMQKILPFITKLTKEYKKLDLDFEAIKGKQIIELIGDLLPIIEQSKDLMDEVLEFVYISLELANENISVTIEGETTVIPLFTREEMINCLQMPDLAAIISALVEVNFTKNPSLVEPKPEVTPANQEVTLEK